MNARQTDSLAAALNGLSRQADGRVAELLDEVTLLVEGGSTIAARDVLVEAHDLISSALRFIEAELAESERGKPKAARKQKRASR